MSILNMTDADRPKKGRSETKQDFNWVAGIIVSSSIISCQKQGHLSSQILAGEIILTTGCATKIMAVERVERELDSDDFTEYSWKYDSISRLAAARSNARF